MQLLIFEAIRFGGRYRYFGGGTRESGCGTYQYSEPDRALVVVSGENAGGAVRCSTRTGIRSAFWTRRKPNKEPQAGTGENRFPPAV